MGLSSRHVTRVRPSLCCCLCCFLGAGHIYCGKRQTGFGTMALFLIPAAVALYGIPDLVKPIALRFAVAIYIFAFIDALLTTREANDGVDCPPNGIPRIAATLNLLTSGLGYFYLGERTLGLVVFVGIRFVVGWVPFYLAMLLQIGFAAHAYVRCLAMYPRETPAGDKLEPANADELKYKAGLAPAGGTRRKLV